MLGDSMLIAARRHPFFYYSGQTVMQTMDDKDPTLFCINAHILCTRTVFYKDMFECLQTSTTLDGTSDEHPIYVPFQTKQFEAFVAYLYKGPDDWPGDQGRDLDFLRSILQVSAFLDCDDGYRWAVKNLDPLPHMSPALRLHLASAYRVDGWVEPAFKALVDLQNPLPSYPDALEYFTLPDLAIIAHTRENIRKSRQLWMLCPPPMHSICKNSLKCQAAWTSTWWKGLGPRVFHPDKPMSGLQVQKLLEGDEIAGICKECKANVLARMAEKDALRKEELVVAEGLAQMQELQMGRPFGALKAFAAFGAPSNSPQSMPPVPSQV
ncbi:hypothetical protein BD626DRAFT_564217 [Schizophyllum amplum]|uniref:BTB domain-containing protein n=1 Tax=Schizophyllum amplum TaxID=97359 RepID=A0A550D0P9_9AGAR|nr:hypothetical protein BD626DRAFT_564217 [Auriculariopsis ampla]